MKKLTMQDFNAMLIGQIYDFYVSMWSCFETSISSMYEELILKKLNNSRFEKIKKIYSKSTTNKAENCDNALDGLINEINKKYTIFISFPDRTNYLLSEVLTNYARDKKKDEEILLFATALRNTVHNNGVHLKANKELDLAGRKFKLEQDSKVYFEDFKDVMLLINEIFDIYLEMLISYTSILFIRHNNK